MARKKTNNNNNNDRGSESVLIEISRKDALFCRNICTHHNPYIFRHKLLKYKNSRTIYSYISAFDYPKIVIFLLSFLYTFIQS